jgi:hypothetical protein
MWLGVFLCWVQYFLFLLDSGSVSWHHCTLACDGGGWKGDYEFLFWSKATMHHPGSPLSRLHACDNCATFLKLGSPPPATTWVHGCSPVLPLPSIGTRLHLLSLHFLPLPRLPPRGLHCSYFSLLSSLFSPSHSPWNAVMYLSENYFYKGIITF